MADKPDLMREMGNAMGRILQDEGRKVVRNGLHSLFGQEQAHANPGRAARAVEPDDGDEYEEGDDEYEEGDDEYEDVELDDEDVGDARSSVPGYLVFDGPSSSRNLAAAAAAWRLFGQAEDEEDPQDAAGLDIVAMHKKSGQAFFGPEELLEKYSEEYGLGEGWSYWDDPGEILALPYDQRAIREALRALHAKGRAEALGMYADFHWGDKASGAVFKSMPGINVPLTFLGTAQTVMYAARKDGKVEFYEHEFGEESGIHPAIYCDPTKRILIIQGGNMRVEPEGIRD